MIVLLDWLKPSKVKPRYYVFSYCEDCDNKIFVEGPFETHDKANNTLEFLKRLKGAEVLGSVKTVEELRELLK